MSLIIALGSNIGEKVANLNRAIELLEKYFGPAVKVSSIYSSAPVGGVEQPDFLNMVIEFKEPGYSPDEMLKKCLATEEAMGRKRIIKWGPRIIDIDILYIGDKKINKNELQVPHPRILERSFVVRPLKELPFYTTLCDKYDFPDEFEVEAYIYE